jgi:hypothetical protein
VQGCVHTNRFESSPIQSSQTQESPGVHTDRVESNQVCSSSRSLKPIPVAARSKAWVCGRSFAGIVGSNSAGGTVCLSVVSVVCCQVEVSASV